VKTPLTAFDAMPEDVRAALSAAGAGTVRRLLDAAALPEDRRTLLDRAGLDEGKIKPWVVVADLCRVPDITPQLAQALALSGIAKSAHAFGQLDPRRVTDALFAEVGEDATPVESTPDVPVLRRAIEQASRLPPRLIWDVDDVSAFETILRARRLAPSHHATRNTLWALMVLILAADTLAFAALACVLPVALALRWPAALDDVIAEMSVAYWLMLVPGWGSIALLVLVGAVTDWAGDGLLAAVRRLVPVLARRPADRRLWLALEGSYDQGPMARTISRALVAMTVIGIAGLIAMVLLYETGRLEEAGGLAWLFTAGLVITIPALIAAVVYHALRLRRRLRTGIEFSQAGLMRYLFVTLGELLSIPVVVLGGGILFLQALDIQHRAVEQIIVPAQERHIERAIAVLMALPEGNRVGLGDTSALIDALRALPGPDVFDVAADPDLLKDLRAYAGTFLIWSLTALVAGGFLVPFALLQRPKEIMVFVALAVVASVTESVLSRAVASIGALPPGTFVSAAMVGFVIVFNSAAYQTVDALGSGGEFAALCTACGRAMPVGARYCPACGVEQRPTEKVISGA